MSPAALSGVLPALAFLAGVLACMPATAAEEADSINAVAAATHEAVQWLDSLDAHRYGESWSDAAEVMHAGRTQEDWVREVGTPRESLGKPLMRELEHAEYSTQVRGAPEGNYVTAAYITQFSKAPPVIETILLTLQDGRWRIAGYSINLAPAATASPTVPQGAGAAPGPKTKE